MSTTTNRLDDRYSIGQRQADGRYPVFVDGAETPSGYVQNLGHGSQPWATYGSEDYPSTYPCMEARRWQAAERVVRLVDARKAKEAEAAERRERAAAPVPEGWRVASWDEIVTEGFRRVRLVRGQRYVNPDHDGQPDAGERYVTKWALPVVRLTSVSRNGRVPQFQATYGDFMHVHYVNADGSRADWFHTVDGNHAIALGALVPVDTPRRTVSAVPCPQCGSHEALYATGARTACGECTARALGWPVEDLPAPVGDDAPMFHPRDIVAADVKGLDGITDTYTGTVHEWRADLTGAGFSDVRVFFDLASWVQGCPRAILRKVDRIAERSAETVGGLTVGAEVVRFDYNRDGVAFEKRGRVVGFSDGPDGERLVRFTSSPVVPAAAYPAGEVYRVGSHAAWCASQPRRRSVSA